MDKVKKILFVVTQAEMGGAQRFVGDASFWLAQKGHNVTVASGGKMSLEKMQTFELKHLKRSPNPFQAIFSIFEIRKLIKKEQPDTLFLCSTMAGILGSLAARFPMFHVPCSKLYVLYRIGGWAFNDPRPFWQKKLIILAEKATARYKDKIIVNSDFDLQSALKNKIAPMAKLTKIYNGINPREINFLPKKQVRVELKLPENDLIVGTIANFYKTKGLPYLIASLSQLFEVGLRTVNQQNIKLVIIGDGNGRKNLEKLIRENNLEDKVILAGIINEARKYLKAFDVFVLPSLKEGFPWVILEAMSAGLPIIATRVGAVPEIIENKKHGLTVEPGDPRELASAIQQILKNPDLAKTLAQNASERVAYFSKQKMMEEILKLIV